jgi:hypothetical protein
MAATVGTVIDKACGSLDPKTPAAVTVKLNALATDGRPVIVQPETVPVTANAGEPVGNEPAVTLHV